MLILSPTKSLPLLEFIILMAVMTGLFSLSVDVMLPALSEMGSDLAVTEANDTQLIVIFLFLGMAFTQLIYGPLSDSLGRKPLAYIGFCIFFIGTYLCITANDFTSLLVGRVLQGVGLGGPRIMSIVIVRDLYSGREMARIMSFIMMVFIFVPIIAPSLGQGILLFAHWRMIFILLFAVGLITFIWFLFRQPETLAIEKRHPMSLKRIGKETVSICQNSHVMIYTICSGIVLGAFITYISTIQQILQNLYALGEQFPLYFALLSCSIGLASFANAKLVLRFGMFRISSISLGFLSVISVVFAWHSSNYSGVPPLFHLLIYFGFILFCIGLLFGNLQALAMEPLGHVAGIGVAVTGFISSMIAAPLAIIIGRNYNQTVLPLVIAFAVCAGVALLLILTVKKNPHTNHSNL